MVYCDVHITHQGHTHSYYDFETIREGLDKIVAYMAEKGLDVQLTKSHEELKQIASAIGPQYTHSEFLFANDTYVIMITMFYPGGW